MHYMFNISIQYVKKEALCWKIWASVYVIQGTDNLFQKRKIYSFLPDGTQTPYITAVMLPMNLTLWPVY